MSEYFKRIAYQLRRNPTLNVYGDIANTSLIPSNAIRGRAASGNTFTGYIDHDNGKIRIDCADDPCMWLEIDLNICAFPEAIDESKSNMSRADRAQLHYVC